MARLPRLAGLKASAPTRVRERGTTWALVKLTLLPEVGYEAELLNLEVPGPVRLSEGATEEEAVENLCQQLAQYSLELQASD